VQTTRTRVLGIAIHGQSQLIFVDTPGIFAPRRRLDRAMVSAAWQGAGDADLIAVVVDAKANARATDPDTASIIEGLNADGRSAALILNKVDLLDRSSLLPVAERFAAGPAVSDIYMVSALTGDGVPDLLDIFAARVPEGPYLFPEDQLSDMNERLLAAEVTREKLFLTLHQELPYALTVETEGWEPRDDGSVKIDQTIYVERAKQKGIVLGAKGARIKSVGAAARKDLEEVLDRRVHLFLFVKVRERWQEDPERYRDWGLDFDA
jgi:GTP-binding protein Era